MTNQYRVISNRSRLLIVDDDESFCQALTRAMERRGFEVSFARDVTSGVEIAERFRPQFSIVDLRVGDESGLTLIARLLSPQRDIRIVVLTGYASIATAVEAIKLGAQHYLTKPAEPDEIVAALTCDQVNTGVQLTRAPMSVRRLEWEHLQRVLCAHAGNVSAAARALNMHRRTLQRKLQKHPVHR